MVVKQHLLPPISRRFKRKMWAKKLTRPILEEFGTIDIVASPTRPSPSNVELVIQKAYHCMSDNDLAEHDDVSITLFPFDIHY